MKWNEIYDCSPSGQSGNPHINHLQYWRSYQHINNISSVSFFWDFQCVGTWLEVSPSLTSLIMKVPTSSITAVPIFSNSTMHLPAPENVVDSTKTCFGAFKFVNVVVANCKKQTQPRSLWSISGRASPEAIASDIAFNLSPIRAFGSIWEQKRVFKNVKIEKYH